MTQTFSVTDFMGIDGTVSITPSGNDLVVLAGAEGQGKSSWRIGIETLIDYLGSRLIPDPIHEGKDTARNEFLDTELDIRLERVFKRAADGSIKTTFAGYSLDGAKYPSGVQLVAKLMGGEVIDPSVFVHYDENKQREVLLSKVELPFDLEEITAKRKGYFDGRTEVTRDVKRLRTERAALSAPPAGTPLEAVSSSEIIAEYNEARSHNEKLEQAAKSAEVYEQELVAISDQIAGLRARIVTLTASKEAMELRRQDAVADSLKAQPIDLAEISTRLAAVEATNADVRAAVAVAAADKALDEAETKEAGLSVKIDAIDKQKAEGLAAAEFPFKGLSVDEHGVTVHGRSFLSLNEGEKQWVAYKIATHGDRKLKLLFIQNGDALDNNGLARIQADAAETGWTVIVDRGRDNSSEIGFVFEAGNLVAAAE